MTFASLRQLVRDAIDYLRMIERVRSGKPPWQLLGDDQEVIAMVRDLMALPARYTGEEREDALVKVKALLGEMRLVLAGDVVEAAEFAEEHGGKFKAWV